MKLKILGGCCKKCDTLLQNTREAVSRLGVNAEIEKISDAVEVAHYGVMTTPALVIDNKVVSYGKVLTTEQIMLFLQKH